MRKIILTIAMLVELVYAQQKAAVTDDQYLKALESRVTKILAPLNIEKKRKQSKVHQIVLTQYQALNTIHSTRDLKIKELKSGNTAPANELKKVIADLESAAGQEITAVHSSFLHDLRRYLTDAQVDAVKDGMTYNVANITFKGYQDMLPALNDSQRTKIWNWLAEAREIAMDAETSEKKHWWFGKYKGRINNYLSSEGFDMKKESEAWQKRIKSASPINTTKNS
jgi:FtsZ-binding cell division protein ZapB